MDYKWVRENNLKHTWVDKCNDTNLETQTDLDIDEHEDTYTGIDICGHKHTQTQSYSARETIESSTVSEESRAQMWIN